jgi:hypothetical protein
VALQFTLKSILRQKRNYENSNISPSKDIIFKNSLKETKILVLKSQLQPGKAGYEACIVAAATIGYPEQCGGIPGFQGAGVAAVRYHKLDPIAMPHHEARMV